MDQPLFALKCRLFLVFAFLSASSSGAFANEAENPGDTTSASTSIAHVQTADGTSVDVAYKPSSREVLKEFSPEVLFKEGEKFRESLRAQCAGQSGSAVARFVKSYPIESASFNLAIGLSAGEQIKEDPAYARHFMEQNVLDPMAHVSFAGFMLGNRAVASFLSMTNLTYDPCRILKRYPMGAAERFEQKEFQKLMGYVAGPIGMSAGLLVSTFLHEALVDPNIRTCAALQIGKVSGDEKVAAAQTSCEKAYEEWVLDGSTKVRGLIPDMISMAMVTGIMAAPQVAAALTNKYVMKTAYGVAAKKMMSDTFSEATLRFTWVGSTRTLLVEGASIAMTAARVIPAPIAKFAFAVGTTTVFLKINDLIAPPLKKGFETIAQGSDIGASLSLIHQELNRVRANGWVFSEKSTALECDPRIIQSQVIAGEAPQIPKACTSVTALPADLIKRLGQQEKKWRDFIMADTSSAASNWQNYVMDFANIYSDTRKFYADILKRVWFIRNKNLQDDLTQIAPLWGVPVSSDWTSGKICDIPTDTKSRFDAAALEIDKQISEEARPDLVLPKFTAKPTMGRDGKSVHPALNVRITNQPRLAVGWPDHYDVEQLRLLQEGFMAMDCRFPLNHVERDLHKTLAQATPTEIENLRHTRYTSAVSVLFWELMGQTSFKDQGAHGDNRLPLDDPNYESASSSNLYMRLNLILGGPEPMYPGITYIKTRRGDPVDINQEMRDQHPTEIRAVATKQMPDYLLTSMVCGPTAEQSITQSKNWSVTFTPPRIVPDLGYDLCDREAVGVSTMLAKPVMLDSSKNLVLGAYAAVADPYTSIWNVKGKPYRSLLEVVKTFASPEIIGESSGYSFAKWWSAHVNIQAEPLFKAFRMRFAHDVIEKKFFPALANPDYSKDRHWAILNAKGLPKGLNNAVMDSLRENLAIIETIIAPPSSQPESKSTAAETFRQLADTLTRHTTIGLNMIGPPLKTLKPAIQMFVQAPEVKFDGKWSDEDTALKQAHPKSEIAASVQDPKFKGVFDDAAFNAYKSNDIDLIHAILNLQAFARDRSQAQGSAKSTLDPVIDAVTENLKALVSDLDAYHGFLVSIRLEEAG